jgi:VanZ family protein
VDYSSVKVSGEPLNIGSGFYLHIIGYFIAAFLFYLVMSEKQNGKMIFILLILFGCGIIFEIIQGYLPKRTYNPMDMVANGVGLIVFYIFYSFRRGVTRLRDSKIDGRGKMDGGRWTREDGRWMKRRLKRSER